MRNAKLAFAVVLALVVVWFAISFGDDEGARGAAERLAGGVAGETSSGTIADLVQAGDSSDVNHREVERSLDVEAGAGSAHIDGSVESTGLVGRVVDPFGDPLMGATVYVAYVDEWPDVSLDVDLVERDGEGKRRAVLTTDFEGRFQFEKLRAGRLRIAVLADGFAPFAVDGIPVRPPLHDVGDLALESGLVLEGRVVDAFDVGVPAARLSREEQKGWSGARHAPLTSTDVDGRFRVGSLAPGDWKIRVESESHPTTLFEGQVFRTGVSSGHLIRLEQAWSIEGRLEVPGEDDYGPYSVQLKLTDKRKELKNVSRETKSQRAQCEADGSFAFKNLQAVDATTTFALEGHRRSGNQVRRVGDAVDVRAGDQDVLMLGEALAAVRFELSGNGPTLEAPTIYLVVWGNNHVNLTARGSVESRGGNSYRIADITRASESEKYSLHVKVPGYRSYLRRNLGMVGGGERDLGRFELEASELLVVRVTDDSTGDPIEGVRVGRESPTVESLLRIQRTGDAMHYDPNMTYAETGGDGIASVPLASGHDSYITATHPDYAPAIGGIASPGVAELELKLSRGSAVRVRVEDNSGGPIAGAFIQCEMRGFVQDLAPVNSWTMGLGNGGKTDADGVLMLDHLPPGETAFTHLRVTGEQEERVLVLEGGGEQELVFVVSQQGQLEIVVHEGGVPLVDAELGLYVPGAVDDEGSPLPLWQRGAFKTQNTNGDGGARFEGLDLGEYDIGVKHPTRAMTAVRPVSVRAARGTVTVELTVSGASGLVLAGDSPASKAFVYAILADFVEGGIGVMVQHAESRGKWPLHNSGVTRTDANGRFEFRGLPFGERIQVLAVPRGHQPALSTAFELKADELRVLPDLVAKRAGGLDVTIGSPDGGQQAGIGQLIQLEYVGESATILRSRDLYFGREAIVRARHLVPGTWRIRLVKRAFMSTAGEEAPVDEKTVDVRAGKAARVQLGG